MSQEDRDRMLALQLQRQEEREREAARGNDQHSERLAQEMQKREYNKQQQRVAAGNARQRQTIQRAVPVQPQRAKAGGSAKDQCIIS